MSAADTTSDLERRLLARYSNAGWSILFGVGDGAGFGNSGWSDAIAMQTWPSKVLEINGFEVKATRSDWLREIGKPRKNETWQACCHEWYIVAPAGVVEPAELPGWGLMVPSGADGLRIAIRARRQEQPTAVSLDLVAAVFRAAGYGRQNTQRAIDAAAKVGLEARHAALLDKIEQIGKEKSEAEEALGSIKAALGGWYRKDVDIIAAAHRIAQHEPEEIADGIAEKASMIRRAADTLERTAAELKAGAGTVMVEP